MTSLWTSLINQQDIRAGGSNRAVSDNHSLAPSEWGGWQSPPAAATARQFPSTARLPGRQQRRCVIDPARSGTWMRGDTLPLP